MAEKSLFYNAMPDETQSTGYDRNYTADDLSSFLSIVCDTGVIKDGLKVETASDGLKINVASGKAVIKGKGYINESSKQYTLETAPTGANPRYDYVVLRYDKTLLVRETKLFLITGTETLPTESNLTRTDDIYELMLAIISVQPNATTIAQTDITDKRGDTALCPWFVATKGYDDYYDAIVQRFKDYINVENTTNSVTTTLASGLYNASTDLISVFVNGILVNTDNYEISTTTSNIVINFTNNVNAGQQVGIELDKLYDGEGLENVYDDYLNLKASVEALSGQNAYIYNCNGVNDNVMITNIVNTFLALNDNYKSLNLSVIGNFGYETMASGNGTFANPYVLFNFAETSTDKKVSIDFSNCSLINVNITNGTTNVFFKAYQLNITGLRINANNTASSTIIRAFNSDTIALECNKCYFWLTAYQDSYISRTGTFNDCYGKVYNTINYSWCFSMTGSGFLNVKGGEYRAYVLDNSTYSAIVGQSGSTSITIMYGVSAPTEAQGSYRQTHSIYYSAGQLGSTYLISELAVYSTDSSKIWATISRSRGNIL